MNKYIASIIMGMIGVSLAGGLKVEAEGLTFQQAPLIYEYELKGPLSIESEIITTTGTITTISAFAESEGEVRLEVSANGGSAYTRLINGMPLTEGFIPGNQLRFKANIAEGGVLKKLTLGYIDTSGKTMLYRNPDLTSFKAHKPIYISGGSQDLFNYPLKVKIEKDIYSQGIYFTAGDGESPLSYYLEEEGAYWVKIPEIPKEGTMLYLYYGLVQGQMPLAGTVPVSDGKKVFAFFDDFKAQGLDEGVWQVRPELKGRYALLDGYLQLSGCSIITADFKMKKGILEFKASAEKNSAIQAIAHGTFSSHSGYPVEELVYSSGYPGAEHTIAINDVAKLNIGKPIEPLTDYIYKVIVNDSGIIFERYSKDYEKQAEISFLDSYKNESGYIGLKADSAPLAGGSVYFDWVRVRPYVEVEPKISER